MAQEVTVKVYSDHYVIGCDAVNKGDLEGYLAKYEDAPPEKKRTYPKGVRRQRKQRETAPATGTEG